MRLLLKIDDASNFAFIFDIKCFERPNGPSRQYFACLVQNQSCYVNILTSSSPRTTQQPASRTRPLRLLSLPHASPQLRLLHQSLAPQIHSHFHSRSQHYSSYSHSQSHYSSSPSQSPPASAYKPPHPPSYSNTRPPPASSAPRPPYTAHYTDSGSQKHLNYSPCSTHTGPRRRDH